MAVENIEIFTGLISLFRGETYQLSWTVLPEDASNKDVTFTIEDATICSISDTGLITAIGNGKTKVAITSVDNPEVNKDFWVASTVVVTSVELEKHTLQLSVGDTYTIPVKISPEDATDKRLTWEYWNWDNPCILVDEDTGLITAIADGTDTVYVSAKSNFDAADQCNVKVWTDVVGVYLNLSEIELGVNQTQEIKYYVYPTNASNQEVNIIIDSPEVASYDNGVITGLKEGYTLLHVISVDNSSIEAICKIAVFNEREPEESDYNLSDRIIQWKADIYFDGKDNAPLTITRDNYLIDCVLLEETQGDSDTPFGNVTANELDLTLLNLDGIFNPTREDGLYYGKIKKGVPIHVFCRPSDKSYVTWDEMGWFYVTEWTTEITGINAKVSASDKIFSVFEQSQVKFPVTAGMTFAEFYSAYFKTLKEEAVIDSTLTEKLLYAYIKDNNKKFLTEISTGAQAFTFCGRNGNIVVQAARNAQEVKHTLTDNDQIISISSKQSTTLEYDGSEVVMNKPQESDVTKLLSVKEITLPAGEYKSPLMTFSKKPVYKLVSALLTGNDNAYIKDIIASCLDVVYTIQNNTGGVITNALDIMGTYLDIVSIEFADEGDDILSVDNIYVQTETYAQRFKHFLDAYVNNTTPILELSIRGNPKYLLGEKVNIVSDRYKVNFTGIIIRQNFHYDGGMSATLTVLNSSIMEVI